MIPKRFRDWYGLSPGETVKFVAGDEGLTIVQERSSRRFIQRIPLLAIETGPTRAPFEAFDVLRRAGGDSFATFNTAHFRDLDTSIFLIDPSSPPEST